jgi:ABC-type multidrug transport system fused ATPase/permease subunit
MMREPKTTNRQKAESDKLGFFEMLRITLRALRTSYKARGRASCIISVLGFALAFLPMLVSTTLRQFTDSVQALFEGNVGLNATLLLFLMLTALYLLQLLYNCIRSYYALADTERISQYIKEYILRCTCMVKLKYIENHDDFSEKIAFADSWAGHKVAESMQDVTLWIQNLIAFIALAVVLASINP